MVPRKRPFNPSRLSFRNGNIVTILIEILISTTGGVEFSPDATHLVVTMTLA
jgi:hypothetical protein